MQKEELIKLDFKQKTSAAAVLFLMFVIMCALFLLNGGEAPFTQNTGKGVFLLFILLLLTAGLYFYLEAFSKASIADLKRACLIAVLFLITFQFNILFKGTALVYSRPLFTFAMLVTVLIGKQEGLFLNAYFMLCLYLFDVYADNYSFTGAPAVYTLICSFVCGTAAVILTAQNSRRFDTIMSAFKLGFLSLLSGAAVFSLMEGISTNVFFIAVSSYLSAHFSLLLHLGLLPLFERIFNIITAYRLSELTDHNRSLLKKLATVAPGTFNHSLAVGNLAEACAIAIGENPQLARAAAYYHDIGKIKNPLYFKENQDEVNPHNDLTPELSANFIKKHASEGYAICRKYRLPEEIANICLEHHGTTVIKYFYFQARKFTEGELSTKQFRYAGPKPNSKIAAIIMIADAAEASIRMLTDRSKKVIEAQVKEIIDERMDLEQFSECDITMKDIYTIIEQIVKISAGIYHERTDYPKLKFSRGDNEDKADETIKNIGENDK